MTAQTASQTIDLTTASRNAFPEKYPVDSWTPENWYKEVLNLPLVDAADRDAIERNLRLQRGWRWNLIPLFILGFVLVDLVVLELLRSRRSRGTYDGLAATGEKGYEHK